MISTDQLILDINLFEKTNFNNYYVSSKNLQVISALRLAAQGRGQHYIYLWGVSGCGGTHLLQASCREADDKGLRSLYLSLANLVQLKPSVFDNLESFNLVCIDDVDAIAKDTVWEEAFFGLFNRMQEAGKRLIIRAKQPPTNVGIILPDLVSRLNSGLIFHLSMLSDEEKEQAWLLRAKDRGLVISLKVIKFLIRHYQRDMKSLFNALDILDRAALINHRSITIPLVKEILKI